MPGEVSLLWFVASLAGNSLTYAEMEHDYWSGHLVCRPFFKAMDMVLEQTVNAAIILMGFLLGYCKISWCEKLPNGIFLQVG